MYNINLDALLRRKRRGEGGKKREENMSNVFSIHLSGRIRCAVVNVEVYLQYLQRTALS